MLLVHHGASQGQKKFASYIKTARQSREVLMSTATLGAAELRASRRAREIDQRNRW